MAVGRGDSGCKFDVESSESSPNRARSSRTHDREIVAARHRSDNRARNLAAGDSSATPRAGDRWAAQWRSPPGLRSSAVASARCQLALPPRASAGSEPLVPGIGSFRIYRRRAIAAIDGLALSSIPPVHARGTCWTEPPQLRPAHFFKPVWN
jgi:hypothetical protein